VKIILGSQSKWRAKELEKAGFAFETIAAGIDEKAIRYDDPEKLVLALAHAKADAILKQPLEPALLITTDQVVVCDGQIREKPVDETEARSFLTSYAQKPAEVVNGLVVTNVATGKRVEGIDRAKIYYKPSIVSVIDELIHNGDVLTCAGSFQAEDPLMLAHVERLEGGLDSFTGMPINLVKRLLKEAQEG
jgi:septum formation protein